MRKETKAGYAIRDFLEDRMEQLWSGRPFDVGMETQQLRAVIGMLTAVGLVEDADWQPSDVGLAARGGRIDGCAVNWSFPSSGGSATRSASFMP